MMLETAHTHTGPDLAEGVGLADIPEGGTLLGHVRDEPVLLVRPAGDEVFAIGPACSHYGGPLADGLIVAGQIRCPWHHARFDLRTGEAVAAPALEPLPCWETRRRGERIVVGERLTRPAARRPIRAPESVVIVGAGAAGNAAAEMLRREGYSGPVTMIGADQALPVDRPNLSKDFLAGTAPEAWAFLRDRDFYSAQRIDLVLGARVVALYTKPRGVELSDGTHRDYGALLLATGADPVKLSVPGSEAPHVVYLRSLADSRAIIAKAAAKESKRAVVVGAGFIGLEVAASLRTRNLEVSVVAPGARPLGRVLGPSLGDFVQRLHEAHGVRFHLGRTVTAIEGDAVVLNDGSRLPADLVVVGIGVQPSLILAERAGLWVDRGVMVNEHLETNVPGVYAAGDIARWVDPRTGKRVRVEHWVVAERQGQTAARNMLGRGETFGAVPFFWSQHYDVSIGYVGHADSCARVDVDDGIVVGRPCLVPFRSGRKIVAVASIDRDRESLEAEDLLERDDQGGLEALMARAREWSHG